MCLYKGYCFQWTLSGFVSFAYFSKNDKNVKDLHFGLNQFAICIRYESSINDALQRLPYRYTAKNWQILLLIWTMDKIGYSLTHDQLCAYWSACMLDQTKAVTNLYRHLYKFKKDQLIRVERIGITRYNHPGFIFVSGRCKTMLDQVFAEIIKKNSVLAGGYKYLLKISQLEEIKAMDKEEKKIFLAKKFA